MQESKSLRSCSDDLSRNPSSRTTSSVSFFPAIPDAAAGRLLSSSSSHNWGAVELDFNALPKSSKRLVSFPPRYIRSIDFNLTIMDHKHFKRCCFASAVIITSILVLLLVLCLVPVKRPHHGSPKNLRLALNNALLLFDAQKSGPYPKDSKVKFRGDSGLNDGITATTKADLVGGFYDSGNNMKFSFPTAYTVTLLSWSVIEYHDKYADIHELDHVKDIIRWGSDYLLKVFIPPSTTSSATLYSQVGSPGNETNGGDSQDNDISCWQRPENMSYERPVSVCGMNASDLAGEIVAGMSAAALVFKEEEGYSTKLVQAAEELFHLATHLGPFDNPGTHTSDDDCGGKTRVFYNSTGYRDELVWGATWLFFATGNISYLDYANDNFDSAEEEEMLFEKGVFSWNNKLAANAILLTRIRYFRDLGYPYEPTLISATNRTDLLMFSYTSELKFFKTEGGLILLKPDTGAALQYAATASFLSKLYSDYLALLNRYSVSCGAGVFSSETLRNFSFSQIYYILGDNPMKMSYLVGFGDHYPTEVHHRAASIPWDSKSYTCGEGNYWLDKNDSNPNILRGAMVAGPDKNDIFVDERRKEGFTEPSISGNAGLVAALIALVDTPKHFWDPNAANLGIDKTGLFDNINVFQSVSENTMI